MSNLDSFKAYDIGRAYAADELSAQSSADRPFEGLSRALGR